MNNIDFVLKFKDLDYALDMVKNDYIYFNSPRKFNDPLDSYFISLIDGSVMENRILLRDYITISNNVYVFCGSAIENLYNVLMWSHYSNYHKGIAIKYRVPKQLFGQLDIVNYDSHKHDDLWDAVGRGDPNNIPNKTPKEKQSDIIKSVFIKNKEWEYENEIRYVKVFKENDKTIEYNWKIEEIYLGWNYLKNTDEKLEEIINIIDLCENKNIKILQMFYKFNRDTNVFQLVKDDWLINDMIDPIENYSRITRRIYNELKRRLKKSIKGRVLENIIEEECEKTINSRISQEVIKILKEIK